jgi:predicted acetyltransferase
MDDSIRLRAATTADLAAISDLMDYVFHHRTSDEERALEDAIAEPERSLVADDAGRVVGHTTIRTRDLTVPGAVLPAAHVTGVGVAPTHRRRGLLKALMHRQLGEVAAAAAEPVAVLWASETSIYPRFGYGPAAARMQLDVMTREVRLTSPPAPGPGRLRLVEPLAAVDELAVLYDRLRPARVGWSSRTAPWWRSLLSDLDDKRDGSALHGVVYDGPDGPAGYAIWRTEGHWDDYGPNARVRIREVGADGTEAYRAIWGFLLGIDLARRATFDFAAVDEPLQYLVDEPRRLGRAYADALWIRLIDLPGALAARRYATEVDVVIEVTDPLLAGNTGRWRLTGGPGKAACERTGDPADFACTVTELGAAYLGGTSLAALAAAGRIRQLTDRLPTAAFGWDRLPNPVEVF